jgi:hypothetical protein
MSASGRSPATPVCSVHTCVGALCGAESFEPLWVPAAPRRTPLRALGSPRFGLAAPKSRGKTAISVKSPLVPLFAGMRATVNTFVRHSVERIFCVAVEILLADAGRRTIDVSKSPGNRSQIRDSKCDAVAGDRSNLAGHRGKAHESTHGHPPLARLGTFAFPWRILAGRGNGHASGDAGAVVEYAG